MKFKHIDMVIEASFAWRFENVDSAKAVTGSSSNHIRSDLNKLSDKMATWQVMG